MQKDTTLPCAKIATLVSARSPPQTSAKTVIPAVSKHPRAMVRVMLAWPDFTQMKGVRLDVRSVLRDSLLVKLRHRAQTVWVDAITTVLCLDTGKTLGD
jgi:hypothetical protein